MSNIPKTIHYCWFGKKPVPDMVQTYINSWRQYLPDFHLKRWDEHNFDVNALAYTREAYYAQKFAFVSDVARLYALVTEGGLYLDTDILIKQAVPEEWFDKKMFVGFEHDKYVQTGVIGAEAGHPILREFYEQYRNRHFICGLHYDQRTNVNVFTKLMQRHGFIMNNRQQEINGVAIFPQELLCGNDWLKGRYDTDVTIMLHDFQCGWGKEVLRNKYKHTQKMLTTCLKWHLWESRNFITP